MEEVLFLGVMSLWTKNSTWHIEIKLHPQRAVSSFHCSEINFSGSHILEAFESACNLRTAAGLFAVSFQFLFLDSPLVSWGLIAYIIVSFIHIFSPRVYCITFQFSSLYHFAKWIKINGFHNSPTHWSVITVAKRENLNLWF